MVEHGSRRTGFWPGGHRQQNRGVRADSEGETGKSGFVRTDFEVPTEYLTDVPPERDGPPHLKVRELQMATALAGREKLDNDGGQEGGRRC